MFFWGECQIFVWRKELLSFVCVRGQPYLSLNRKFWRNSTKTNFPWGKVFFFTIPEGNNVSAFFKRFPLGFLGYEIMKNQLLSPTNKPNVKQKYFCLVYSKSKKNTVFCLNHNFFVFDFLTKESMCLF